MPAKLRLVSLKSPSLVASPRICARCLHQVRIQARYISSTRSRSEEAQPRWAHTPERLTAPVSMNFHNKDRRWPVNESSKKLDEFYDTLLGEGGSDLLTEEVKWLAMTYKTFEQGKRGYNDRLAFFGKRIYNLQTSLALLNRTDGTFSYPPDKFERTPFQHPGIDLLPRLTIESQKYVTDQRRIADFATRRGMLRVMRWIPRDIENLQESGVDLVLSSGLFAVIGAVALQRGGEIANRVVQERILPEIGLGHSDES